MKLSPKVYLTEEKIRRAPLFWITSRYTLTQAQYLKFCNPYSFLGHLKCYILFNLKALEQN